MFHSPYCLAALLLSLSACTARPSAGDSAGDTTTDTSSSAASTSMDPIDGVATGSASTTEAGSSTMTIPGGPPSMCGPPCDETWTHVGDLYIGDLMYSSTDEFKCMTRVVGNLDISDLDQAQLSGLRNLVSIEGSLSILSDTLTDLSPLSCLEEVTWQIQLGPAVNLTDLSGLDSLRFTQIFALLYTAATALPTFAPDFAGLGQADITGNPELVDLDGAATWKTSDEGVWTIVRDNESLKSVAGLQPLLASSPTPPHVWLENLPALESLAGLEGLTALGHVDLVWLPLVPDLAPLTQLKSVAALTLGMMPLIQDLQPLSQLESAGLLGLGSCVQYDSWFGLDGLTSLAGLSSLTTLDSLMVVDNENLMTLAGADKLTSVSGSWSVDDNPALHSSAIDAFAAQVGSEPCWRDDPECICYHRPDDDIPH
ncbi:hypothetical protein OV090_45405 [Nannocystis sp. RBIL2]|uniref:hypothetical protein n=1 Tax=Nannocystis sp. RBIL2 TaxID=2996788 RepID=UPI002270CC4E|nr:hypothetical protein [Nannocystis sp. RBIL2]MCY1072068.1 hypothetical protein [Nannocystis sp. RBIL2]